MPDPHLDVPYDDPKVPGLILAKLVNRRRRFLNLKSLGAEFLLPKEQDLINEALDELSSWAEEHAPNLFYNKKEGG